MQNTQNGFTIVELIVVIVVVSILAVVTVVTFNGFTARAEDSRRDASVVSVKKALEMYRSDNNGYPPCGNLNVDCGYSWLESQLVPNYMEKFPPIKSVPGQPHPSFFNNGVRTSYTLFIPYQSKPSCKTGINPSLTYRSAYPMCT